MCGNGKNNLLSTINNTAASRYPILILILLLSFSLHVTGIDRESLWRDEVDSIRFASEVWQLTATNTTMGSRIQTIAGYLTRPGWNGPLYFMSLEPWFRLVGRSEMALRYPSTLAASVAVALVFALGTRLFKGRVGKTSALLVALNPYLAWYASEGKMYAHITTLALLSTYLLCRSLADDRLGNWIGYAVVTTILFYSHILTPLLLPIQIVIVLLKSPRVIRSPAAWLAAAVLILPYLPLLWWQWPHITQTAQTGFPFVALPLMAKRVGEVFSRGIIGWPPTIPLILLVGAMLLGSFGLPKRRCLDVRQFKSSVTTDEWVAAAEREKKGQTLKIRMILATSIIVPLLELYVISLRRPLFTERYLIWTLPSWLILAAAGLIILRERGSWGHRIALLWTAGLALTSLLGIAYQWATPVRADLRSATALVVNRYQPGDLVLFQIPYIQHSFDYYAPNFDYRSVEGPYTNAGATGDEVAILLQKATAGHDRVWLVLSEVPMWDNRNLTVEWFSANGDMSSYPYNRVEVIEWQHTIP